MLKLAGAFLIIIGCSGYGWSLGNIMQKRIAEMKSIIYMFQLLKSAVSYRRETLPDACRHAGDKLNGTLEILMHGIAEEMDKNRHALFTEIWDTTTKEYFQTSVLNKLQKELILKFPEYIGYSDEDMQITVIEEYISQLNSQTEEMEKKITDQKKVIMGVSTVSGMILTILLL